MRSCIAPEPRTTPRKFLVIARDMEHASNALTMGPSFTWTSPSARAGSRRVRQSGAGHASRDLIEVGKEAPDVIARVGTRKVWSNSTPSDSTAIQASPDISSRDRGNRR